jgi:osmoprotectant transport system permease protein
MTDLLRFWVAHRGELLHLTGQHLLLVGVSTAIAVLAGVPAGVLAAKRPRIGRPILAFASIAQTIPSLALFGFLLPLPFIGGVGPRTALVTLTLYALLPVVRTTMAGVKSVDRAVVEAGVAMGMTARQLLFIVELPLALPSIVSGIRVAAVIGVGTATIAAAIGAGGLGEYIFRGLSMVDTTTILAGAVPAAVLALAVDGLLAWTERTLSRRKRRSWPIAVAVAALALLLLLPIILAQGGSAAPVVVGSKNFTEQLVLGEILAQTMEADGIAVLRKLNLGGTFICDRAIRNGDIDVYPEYTGTAVTAVFHKDVPHDSARALDRARTLYAAAGLTMMEPLGFDNTFAILVRSRDARTLGLRSIDELRRVESTWQPGFGYEFLQRADGYPGLLQTYGLAFARAPRAMDLSLIYKALADGQLDVIAGDATSAMIDAMQLTRLEDTRHYFPPYDAVPIVRSALLLKRPEVRRALNRLAGQISAEEMQHFNKAVDVDRRDPADVARAFVQRLKERGR